MLIRPESDYLVAVLLGLLSVAEGKHEGLSKLQDVTFPHCLLCQSGQSSTVIENIHTIIAAAAVKFNSDQLNHLFVLIQKVRVQSAAPAFKFF